MTRQILELSVLSCSRSCCIRILVASGFPEFLLRVSVCCVSSPSLTVGLRSGSRSASVINCMLQLQAHFYKRLCLKWLDQQDPTESGWNAHRYRNAAKRIWLVSMRYALQRTNILHLNTCFHVFTLFSGCTLFKSFPQCSKILLK